MSEKQNDQAGALSHKVSRFFAVDALRGLIIALMAVDHASHFVAQHHSSGEYWGGPFPRYSDALTYLTRLATHLSAPGFFFLMGVGMALFAISRQERGWSKWTIVGHFLIRGALLIGLQLLVVNRAWELSPGGWALETYIGVLFALGGTMILGSLLLWLKPAILLPLTLILVVGAELLTPAPDLWREAFHPITRLLLVPGGDLELWVNYPILPWLELVAFGIFFGQWLTSARQKAFKWALGLGAGFILVFLVLRYFDGFGNIRPRGGNSWIHFLNVVKYPPSITFSLLTMGVNLAIMGLFGLVGEKLQRYFQPLVVFGRSPLFFYLAHLFLYAGLGHWLTPHGTSIPKMYLFWLLGLLILYPLCRWYGQLKQRQPANSILHFL